MSVVTQDPTADDDLVRRRAEAIEVSGWGERFHLFQPRNACFWVVLALSVTGLVKMVQMFTPLAGYFAPAFAAAGAIAVACTFAWGWWFHHIDHFERQPFGLVALCFVWGGLAAPFAISIAGNTALGSLYSKLFGAVWSADWHAGLSAPFVEESSKAAGFILALGLARRLIRTPADGIFLGAFIGLGFQTFEDFLYAVSASTQGFGSDQVHAVTGGIATRVFSDVVSHPMFTALVCAGLVYLIGTPAQPRRVGRGLALVAAGVGIHLFWDSMLVLSAELDVPTLVVLVFAMVVSLGLLWYAFRLTDHRERELARDILAPEVVQGVLSQDELAALTGHRQRRAFLKAAPDRRERRRRRHVLAAAVDLCADLARSDGGPSGEDEVARSRDEIARLRGGPVPA